MAVNETHPYNSLYKIPAGTLLLVIGTAPPQRFSQPQKLNSGDVDFYYGSRDNQLWTVIFPEIYKDYYPTSFDEASETRRHFLRQKKIWMHDICSTYTRSKSNASDAALNPLTFSDLRAIFSQHPTIHTLVFTGAFAEKWSGQRMEAQGLIPSGYFQRAVSEKRMPRRRRLEIIVNGIHQTMQTFTLPSPSYANARAYNDERKLKMYSEVFLPLGVDHAE